MLFLSEDLPTFSEFLVLNDRSFMSITLIIYLIENGLWAGSVKALRARTPCFEEKVLGCLLVQCLPHRGLVIVEVVLLVPFL